MLSTSVVESGASIEAVVSDYTGLGRLEAVRVDPPAFGLSHIPHVTPGYVVLFSFLDSDSAYRPLRAAVT